ARPALLADDLDHARARELLFARRAHVFSRPRVPRDRRLAHDAVLARVRGTLSPSHAYKGSCAATNPELGWRALDWWFSDADPKPGPAFFFAFLSTRPMADLVHKSAPPSAPSSLDRARLDPILTPIVRAHGGEVVDVEFKSEQG